MRKLIFFALLGLAAWWAYGHFTAESDARKTPQKSPPVKVTVAPAARADVPVTLQLAGNVIAYETVPIKARLDSVITEVAFKDGDHVKKGQLLFRLDDRALKAQLGQQKATLDDLKLQYDRAKLLIVNKAIAQAALDTAKSAYEAQQAAVDSTQVLLSYTTINAPIEGRAGTINATLGNNVKANDTQPLVTINRVSPIRVQFSIPERYYEQVRDALSRKIPVKALRNGVADAPEGKLEYIDNTIDTTTGAFVARAVFGNENEALWPGMFTTVVIELDRERGVLTVPAVSVQGDTGNNFVYRAQDGKAVKTPVEVARTTKEVAVISKGLEEGDEVLVDGLMRVADGSAIEVPEAPKPQPEETEKAAP